MSAFVKKKVNKFIPKKTNLNIKNKKKHFLSSVWNIYKLYWKETLIYLTLTLLSSISGKLAKNNVLTTLLNAPTNQSFNYSLNWQIGFLKLGTTTLGRATDGLIKFLMSVIIITLVYTCIVVAHIYWYFYIKNKIVKKIKRDFFYKLSSLKNPKDYIGKALFFCSNKVESVPNLYFHIPCQFLLFLIDTFLDFGFIYTNFNNASFFMLIAAVYIFFMFGVFSFLNTIVYKKNILFGKKLHKQNKEEEFLISRIDLIIKKSLITGFKKEYLSTLDKGQIISNSKDKFLALSMAIPSNLLTKLSAVVFFPFVHNNPNLAPAALRTDSAITAAKQVNERIRELPEHLASYKIIKSFFDLEERDDIQNNIVIKEEQINSIMIENLNFSFPKRKVLTNIDIFDGKTEDKVFENLNVTFSIGQINYFTGKNGFGKSTLMSIIMGMYQEFDGDIVINKKFNLKTLNLIEWRKMIAFSEHDNLIYKGFSTGQRQIIDIKDTLDNLSGKHVIIFDEADNALDKENRDRVRKDLLELSKKKLVIFISHTS